MKCENVRNEMKAYIDGELGLISRWRVARHLAYCSDCREEEKAMTDLTAKLRGTETARAPSSLRSKIMSGIEFKPREVRLPGWRIPVPAAVASVVVLFLVGAVLMPTLSGSRSGARVGKMPVVKAPSAFTPGPSVQAPMATTAEPKWRMKPQASTSKTGEASHYDDTSQRNPSASSVDIRARHLPQSPLAEKASAWSGVQLQIIKTADMSVEVKSFEEANDDAVTIAQSVGGYVTDSASETEGTTPTSGSLTVRVPSFAFERTVARLGKLGVMKSKSISGEDVTGEVVDLQSRLRNKQAEERQYLEIMDRARRVPDIVTVTEELSRVRGEIEEAQGRLKYLISAADMSTINLSLFEKKPKAAAPPSPIGRAFGDALGSLGRTGNALASLLIWLAVYSPFWALPIGAAIYYRRKVRGAEHA